MTTLKAGSALLMMCVNDTATLDILTVAATCPIVCARATLHRALHVKVRIGSRYQQQTFLILSDYSLTKQGQLTYRSKGFPEFGVHVWCRHDPEKP
jgi:hypothetical protein